MENDNTKLAFVQKHPVLIFLLINFGWTWIIWFAAIPLGAQNNLLFKPLVLLGGFGPALGAMLTLGLRSGGKFDLSPKRFLAIFIITVVLFILISKDLVQLPIIVLIVVFITSMTGGWVFSSAISGNRAISERMSLLLPLKTSPVWLVSGFLFTLL